MEYPEAYSSPFVTDEFLAPLLESVSADSHPFLPDDCLYASPVIGDEKLKVGDGEEDDEGFEDFCEDEDVLIRQGNPNLPNEALSLQEINSADLEDLFLPSTGLDTDDLFMATPLVLPAEMTKQPCDELLELDQGVAMEVSADHHGFTSETQAYDLTLNNSPISSFSPSPSVVTSSSFPDVLCSPYLTSPATQQTFTYPTPPPPAPVSVNLPDQLVAADNPLPSLVPVSASRQNSELDLICTILGEDMVASCNKNTQPTTLANSYSDSCTLQLHDVHSLMINSPPQSVLSCDGSTFTDSRTDCDVSSLASSLPSPTPWLCAGKNLDTERSNRGSQTERRLSLSRSPIAEPMQTSSDGTPSPLNRSRGSTSSDCGTGQKEQYIKMPFYDFKKILDDPTVSERDKEDVKSIRRRGKNKVAAKVCRQRKLDLINGLQYEIDLLKGEKDKLLDRTKAEQQRLQWYKHRWSQLAANNGGSSTSTVVIS